MTQRISKSKRARMQNPILQFFRYLRLNLKILKIVAKGHGSTRDVNYNK